MGETQIRAGAKKLGTEALRPQFDALEDLAVAAAAAGQADKLLAAAKKKAEKILQDAKAEIERRNDVWRQAYERACDAGWTARQLRGHPINQPQPPKRSRSTSHNPAGDGVGAVAGVSSSASAPADRRTSPRASSA